jgi:hypothetical protein
MTNSGMRVVIATSSALCVVGCFSSGRTDATFTGRSPRSDAALHAAAVDLGCPLTSVHVEAETGRRYLNETAFRFVIDGCGERAGYVEICDLVGDPAPPGWTSVDGSLACRYLLVSRVRVAPVAPAPAAGLVPGQ